MRTLFSFILAISLCFPPQAFAKEITTSAMQRQMETVESLVRNLQSTINDLEITIHNQNEVIESQNNRLRKLEGSPNVGKSIPAPQVQAESPIKVAGLSQGFNPDIGVVGTVQASHTESNEDGEGNDTITLKELELSFAQYVDPFSRFDVIIAFNDNLEPQNVDVEEAYYTHWGLPLGFVARIGKFRAKVGQQNLMHLHQLPTVDYPLVIQDFFGEEGMSSSGARIQNQIPNPFDVPLTLTGEIFRGNNGDSFGGISRRPVFNTHLGTFFELSEDIDLSLGANFMVGDENLQGSAAGSDNFGVKIWGFDSTLNWFMENEKKLTFQNEFYYQRRTNRIDPNRNPWGFFSLLDFQFAPKWKTGIRFDLLEPRGVIDGHSPSTAVSPYITFIQSEFANFQLQYQHKEDADPGEISDDAVFLRANFLIGAHSHPVQ